MISRLENKLYQSFIIGSGKNEKDYLKSMAYCFKHKLPMIIGAMENESRITKKHKNILYKKEYKKFTVEERKNFFFKNFYEYLDTIYEKDFMRVSGEKILTSIIDWFNTPIKVAEQRQLSYKLNNSREERIRKELGLSYSKLDVLKNIKNGRPIFTDTGKIELEIYSKKGLERVLNNVNSDMLSNISTFYVEGEKYIKQKDKFINQENQKFSLYKSEKSGEMIGYSIYTDTPYSNQRSFMNKKSLNDYLGKEFNHILTEKKPTKNKRR